MQYVMTALKELGSQDTDTHLHSIQPGSNSHEAALRVGASSACLGVQGPWQPCYMCSAGAGRSQLAACYDCSTAVRQATCMRMHHVHVCAVDA